MSLIAPARLHFGFLDPTGLSGRKFASLGLVIEGYNVELEVRRSKTLIITGDALDEETTNFFGVTITRLKKKYGFNDDFKIILKEKPPRHSGFGSGTQLALALGRALLEIINLKPRTEHLSLAVNRGKRSGIGILGFDKGGFIVDGGKLTDARQPPLISRVCFPKNWKILLVMQDKTSHFYGDREIKALEGLPKITKEKSSTLCRETLLRVIPAIIDKDFDSFAKGLTNIQNLMGEIFFNAQDGSTFSSPSVGKVISNLAENFEIGSGQSSWGPTGFAIFKSKDELQKALTFLKKNNLLTDGLRFDVTCARNRGYQIFKSGR